MDRCQPIPGFDLPVLDIGLCKNPSAHVWMARALSPCPVVASTTARLPDTAPSVDFAQIDPERIRPSFEAALARRQAIGPGTAQPTVFVDASIGQVIQRERDQATRACPICESQDAPPPRTRDGGSSSDHDLIADAFSRETWDVLGLGQVDIGFRICESCGLVLQDPAVPRAQMIQHYETFSNYTNPGREGRPTRQKERNVARQIAMVRANQGEPGNVFQIGCSDGYTLSRFAAEGWTPRGIDPSAAAQTVARERHGIEIDVGDFESADPVEPQDLIVATHVLEHIYEPIPFLRKAGRMLKPGGRLLIEVPCLISPERWPNGYFAFEHVQYFSEQTLRACLRRAGFRILKTEIHEERLAYPIVCVLAEADSTQDKESPPLQWSDVDGEPERARDIVRGYLRSEYEEGWGRIDREVLPRLSAYGSVCVWGAGIHTSQLFAKTRIHLTDIDFIVDSDPQKVGQTIAGIPVRPVSAILEEGVEAVVISTAGSEADIYAATEPLRRRGVAVFRLYDPPVRQAVPRRDASISVAPSAPFGPGSAPR